MDPLLGPEGFAGRQDAAVALVGKVLQEKVHELETLRRAHAGLMREEDAAGLDLA